jgi:hypothetical protein
MLDENYTFISHINSENFDNLKKNIYFENMSFELKNEFHLTIIGNRIGQLIKTLESKYTNIKSNIEEKINNFSFNIDFKNDFYIISQKKLDSEDYKYSIIQLVECPDLINLFKTLNQDFPELDLKDPFPHVTLYTFNGDKGIGIYSKDEFEKYIVSKIEI